MYQVTAPLHHQSAQDPSHLSLNHKTIKYNMKMKYPQHKQSLQGISLGFSSHLSTRKIFDHTQRLDPSSQLLALPRQVLPQV